MKNYSSSFWIIARFATWVLLLPGAKWGFWIAVSGFYLEFCPSQTLQWCSCPFSQMYQFESNLYLPFIQVPLCLTMKQHNSCPNHCSPCLKFQARSGLRYKHINYWERQYWEGYDTATSTWATLPLPRVPWNYVCARKDCTRMENSSSRDDRAFILHVKGMRCRGFICELNSREDNALLVEESNRVCSYMCVCFN